MDHVFVLNSIIDIYLQKRKRVYCSFIDYKKAFDLFDSLLLYADDTIVMAETPDKLQVYLGVKFNYNGNYKKMIAKQITQARKALYCMLTKARKLQLPIDIQCQLFDHLVLPILRYGSEVWSAVAQW